MSVSDAAPPSPPGEPAAVTVRRRLRPNQFARRRRVVEVAMAMAEEGGYDAVAMKEVADRAEVSLATLYRWFSSKDHLLAEVLLAWIGDLETGLRASPPEGASAADRVAGLMQFIADTVATRPRLAHAIISALLSFDEGVVDSVAGYHAAMQRWIDIAVGGDQIEHRDAVVEVLEHVVFASLIGLVRGIDTPESVGARLILATRLMITPSRPS